MKGSAIWPTGLITCCHEGIAIDLRTRSAAQQEDCCVAVEGIKTICRRTAVFGDVKHVYHTNRHKNRLENLSDNVKNAFYQLLFQIPLDRLIASKKQVPFRLFLRR